MTKTNLKLLEYIFAKEIAGGILQSKDKRYKDLEQQGYVRKAKIILGGRFPVTIKGWILTERGNCAYCMSMNKGKSWI